ncbi:class I SAM-dependent methyltransferase [uncultured Ruminococcus sp.]|uniref:class I SAM-dependent DNA methyltransferase n=1 Tax=uncultured Ruminococcus sp. TaxID=165186 RepID=UPI0025D9D009|nr:class I SAM-dependent methyltransferase [uncultured Ruminococcus sp.]
MNSDHSYGVFARYYDLLTENVDYEARAAYLDGLIRRLHPVEDCLVLDLACGTGSLSEALARRGYDVIGVDGSGEMLNEAIGKKCESGLPIQYVCQDMRRLELYGRVDVTVCMLDSLNHLPGLPDVQRVFERVSRYTEPGGLFLFDVNTLHKHRVTLGDQVFLFDLDEIYCVWENRFDGEDTVTITLDFFETEDGIHYTRTTEQFRERAYPRQVLEDALIRADFAVEAVYGADSLEPPSEDTDRLIFIARKK